jgi:hypothetical protein
MSIFQLPSCPLYSRRSAAKWKKIQRCARLLLFLTLAGCGAVFPGTQSTYLDTKNTIPRVYSSKLERSLAAICVIKNIDEHLGFMIAALTPEGPRPNVLEVRGRSEAGFAAIIEIETTDGGSTMTTWVSNHYPFKGAITNRITEGC